MPTYKLHYFDMHGAAEVSRQLFILSGTPFIDSRISKEQWPLFKETTPFGHLPVLEVDGRPLPQSQAIARYLAKEFGFYGKTPFESAWVDALADQIKDFLTEMRPYFDVFVAGSDKEKARVEIAMPAISKHFPFFEKAAKDNGSNGHFVGDSLTFVDVYIADRIVTIDGMLPGFADAYPSVLAIRDKVINDPRLKEWIATRGTRRVAGEVLVDLRK
ncbi:hypothetical protein PRIPAC_81054 [Pristionchus pacificus]|uniref:glutathione transferase n=1 Tax=Pristionchus pacificus TaxID=54126 RepID=A0A454XNC6_PRIPA|nr:hypothetical protein PRIPAC_81054 [Pristionchus pacificus]|eukprot:PDM65337.1 Glutathione S-transferase [Pristionchus pacificus]